MEANLMEFSNYKAHELKEIIAKKKLQ